ncbi:MAG: hypothetical protein ACRYGK_16400 [Janthinobacterium lividum]
MIMDAHSGRIVIGYHGCDAAVVEKLLQAESEHLKPSINPYDWLGDGIYCFEDDAVRALKFAQAVAASPNKRFSAKKNSATWRDRGSGLSRQLSRSYKTERHRRIQSNSCLATHVNAAGM